MWIQMILRLLLIASTTLIVSIRAWNCGADINPPQISFHKSPRRLSQTQDSLQPIRVYFEFDDFQFEDKDLEELYYDVFEVLELYLENLLSVYPYTENLVFNDIEECGDYVDIPQDHKTTGVEADLVVYVTSYFDYDGILAFAGPCILNQQTYAPLSGLIVINQYEIEPLQEPADIFALLFHEMTHILGFNSGLYEYFVDQNKEPIGEENVFTEVQYRGKDRYLIQTPTVKSVTEQYFGCQDIQGMELEDYYQEPGSHWQARIMFGDYMISQFFHGSIITKITLALIQDTGYWTVNLDLGQIPVWGTSIGCEFFDQLCIINEQPISDEFCVESDAPSLCDYYHFGKGQCNIDYGLDIPEEYQYFNQTTGGRIRILDYCPIVETYTDCRDEQLLTISDSLYITEEFCQECRCFMSDLEQGNQQARVLRADCYRVLECLESSYTVKVQTEVIECTTQGPITVQGYSGTFQCPKYEKICGERPCKDLCYAQGSCIEGECHCNQGRGGENCSLECYQTCYNCVSQSEYGCTSCREGENCLVCQMQNCLECNPDGTQCQACKEGYGVTQDGSCEYCNIPDCLNCDDDQNSCKQCKEGLAFNNDQTFCQPCKLDYCINCQTDLETCYQCEQGWIPTYDYSECIQCWEEKCLLCQKNGVDCHTCQEGYLNENGECNCQQEYCEEYDLEGDCIQCQKGFGFNTEGTCSPCEVDYCQDCSDQLSKCSDCQYSYDYYQAQNECRPNCDIDNCAVCFDWDECQICQYGFQLTQDWQCQDCLVENCQYCNEDSFYECQYCNEYFGLDQEEECQACSDFYCLNCYWNYLECNECRNFFMLDQDYSCKPCQVWGCQYCYQDPSLCAYCIYGYKPDNTNTACVSCIIDNCNYCQYDDTDCRECQEPYFLNYQGLCEECMQNCEYCSRNDDCDYCFDGYYFDGQSCLLCQIDNCKQCDYDWCYECYDGYSSQDGECVSCEVEECKSCYEVQICDQCFEGFYFNSTYNLCLDCNLEGCKVCDYEPGVICEECLEGFRWVEGYVCEVCDVEYCSLCDRKIDECDECFQGFEYDQSTKTCYGCPVQGCEECNQHDPFVCNQCKQGYRKEEDYCEQCSKENCADCQDDKDNCQQCITNYTPDDEGNCRNCLVDNCDQCISGDFYTCLSCQQGYKLESQGTSCQQCLIDFCVNCSSNISSCQDCLQGYRLTSQGKCQKCQIENCEECNQSECNSCLEGFGFDGDECSSCQDYMCIKCSSAYNKCQQCQSWYQPNTEGECDDCIVENCDWCLNNNPNSCEYCQDYYGLTQNNECHSCSDPRCLSCDGDLDECQYCQDFYGVNQQGFCQECNTQNCLDCDVDYMTCYWCKEEYQLIQHQVCTLCEIEFCIQCEQSDRENTCLQCYQGYYFDTDWKECFLCQVENCASCDQDQTKCESCKYGYGTTDDQGCDFCSWNCKDCQTRDQCTECQDWYALEEGQCKDCLVENCQYCNEDSFYECQYCNEYFGFDQEEECQVCSEFYCLNCDWNYLECQECRNFFMLDQDYSCKPCQVWGCQNCYQDPSLCAQCIYGYKPDNTNTTCVSCIIDNCNYCQYDDTDCRECQEPYFLNYQGLCEECMQNCEYCSRNDDCDYCFDGYYFDGQSCLLCQIDNCKQCDYDWCYECYDGYSSQDGECVSCEVEECKSCYEVQICDQCFEGFYFNSTLNLCLDCNLEGCKVCDYEPGVICEECLEGFRWVEGYVCEVCDVEYCSLCDRKIDECDECFQGFEYDQSTKTCYGCPVQDCEECNQHDPFVCNQCKQGYRKEEDYCEQCSKENCADCQDDKDNCQQCITNYTPDDEGNCRNCLVDNCDQCISGDFYTCLSCQQGYKLESQGTSCQQCLIDFCVNCSSNISSCQDCLQGYRLTSQGKCQKCQIENCEDCNQSECNSCLEGFGFDGDECSPCQDDKCIKCSSAYNKCQQCQLGYQPNTEGECDDCIVENCDQCLNNNPNSCEYCQDYYRLTQNYECHPCSDPRCLSCGGDPDECQYCKDFYGVNQQGVCQECNTQNCLDCDVDYMTCYWCKEEYQLIQHQVCTLCEIEFCIQCEQSDRENTCLQCYQGYYFDTDWKECFQCQVENCASCDQDQTKCESCKYGYGTTNDQGCDSCSWNCKDCQTRDQCTECQDWYALEEGQCKDCIINFCDECETQNPRTCNTCSQGYVVDENGSCIVCTVQNCVDCQQRDANSCKICQDGYFLQSDGECTECHNNLCLTCQRGENDNQSICDSCSKGTQQYSTDAQLSEGDCSCAEGSYEIQGICYQLCELCKSCTENLCDCVDNADFDQSNEVNVRCQCLQSYIERDGACILSGIYFKANQVEATFNEDYNKIEVNFDEPTNEYSNNCQDLLQEQSLNLLDDPSCTWTNNKQLQITLGSEFQLEFTGNGVIILNGRNIQQLEGTPSTEYQKLEVQVEAIYSYPVPEAIVQGPDEYSISCSTKALSISGEASEVKLTDFPEYSWNVESQTGNIPQTLNSNVISETTPKLSLDSSLFTSEGTYTFILTIQNKFNSVDTAEHSVVVTNQNKLSLVLSNAKPTVTAYQNREFIADVKEFCGNKVTPNYSWSYEGLQQGEESDLPSGINPSSLIPNGVRNHVLVLNQYQLAPGFTYIYQATAIVDGVSGSILLSIKVESSELEADIGRTGDGQYNSNIELELDGSNSRDPDSDSTELIFSWGCIEEDQNGQQNFCTGVGEEPLFDANEEIQQELVINSDLLKPGDVYVFTVTVQDGNTREDSDSVELSMVDAGNIQVNFVSTQFKVQTSRPFLLQTNIQGEVSSLQWTQISGSSVNLNTDSQSGFLSFEAFTLSEGQFYTFQISVQDLQNHKLEISLTINTNLRPFCNEGLTVQKQSSIFIFQEFTLSMDQCDDGDYQDYPLKYSFGIQNRGFSRTLSYLSEVSSASILLYPGTFNVVGKVCDSLTSCNVYTNSITSSATRRLDQQEDILQSYNEANSNQDLIPFNTLIFSDYYNLTTSLQDQFLDTLEGYSNTLTTIDESMTSSIISATVSLLFQPFAEDEQILNCLEYLQEIIERDEDFLLQDDIELMYLVFDELLQEKYPSEDFEVLSEIKTTIQVVMNNRRQNKTPNSDTEVFQSQETLSSFGIYKGQDLEGLQLTLGDQIEVVIPSLEVFQQDYMYSLLVSQFPNAGNSSDFVDISFYQHGSYVDFNLDIKIGQYKDLENLQNMIQVSFPCNISDSDISLYECLVFEEQENSWKDGQCSLESITGGLCLIYTQGTSLFQISLIQIQTEVSQDQDCDVGRTPIWMLQALVAVGFLLIIIAFLRQRAQKESNQVKNLHSQGNQNIKSTRGTVTKNIEKSQNSEPEEEVQNLYKNPQEGEQSKEDIILQESEYYIQPIQGFYIENLEQPTIEVENNKCSLFLNHHLLFGQFQFYYLSQTQKAALLVFSLIISLGLVGLLLWLIQDIQETDDDAAGKIVKYLYISIISAVFACLLVLVLDFLVYKWKQSQSSSKINIATWVCIWIFSIFSILVVILLGLEACEEWDLLWVILFAIAAIIELFLLETLVAVFKIVVSVSIS